MTGAPALRNAADRMVEYARKLAPRAADGTVFHAGKTMWSDSFHTTPPLLACAGHWDEAIRQIEGHRRRLWNPQAKLLAHIWDEEHGRLQDGKFWGGGHGWAAAALARVIRALPEERKADRVRLAGYLREILDGCLAHQLPSGLFRDVVDAPSAFEETNLAQMLAYAIYVSVSGGWLPRGIWRPPTGCGAGCAGEGGCRRVRPGCARRRCSTVPAFPPRARRSSC